jgi:hypothetical protein
LLLYFGFEIFDSHAIGMTSSQVLSARDGTGLSTMSAPLELSQFENSSSEPTQKSIPVANSLDVLSIGRQDQKILRPLLPQPLFRVP